MRILVTGADGFVGAHAVTAFSAAGHTVIRACGPEAAANALNLTSYESVRACIQQAAPETVLHLAGASSVSESHKHPIATFQVNTLGTVHLLEALRQEQPKAKFVLVSSGEVYGGLAVAHRAKEDEPCIAKSPYASSKVCAETAALQFHKSYGLHVVVARPFNHLGRGQASHFVVPSFAQQLHAIRLGKQSPIVLVGNLEPVRDFSHVEDVVDAYLLLLTRAASGSTYNIASGEPRRIRDVLDELISLSGTPAKVEVDAARLRPAEIPWLVGDPSRLRELGWTPRRSVTQALQDVLDEVAHA